MTDHLQPSDKLAIMAAKLESEAARILCGPEMPHHVAARLVECIVKAAVLRSSDPAEINAEAFR